MASAGSGRRYAQAVFEIARDQDSYEEWLRDLQTLADVFGIQEVQTFLEEPRVSSEDKEKLLDEHLPSLSPLAKNLSHVLMAKKRIALAPGIFEAYQEMVDEERGVVSATVTSALALDAESQKKIEETLQERVGRELRLSSDVDPDLVGGLVIRVGDRVIDGSTRTRLRNLRSWLREESAS